MSERKKRAKLNTIPATQARIHFGELLKRVYMDGEHLTIEKDGLPIATLLSHAEYEQLRRSAALRELEELNRAANRAAQAQGLTEEQALADLQQIKKEVYEERYGRARRSRHPKAA
jgi:prevent-host-death family protein